MKTPNAYIEIQLAGHTVRMTSNNTNINSEELIEMFVRCAVGSTFTESQLIKQFNKYIKN